MASSIGSLVVSLGLDAAEYVRGWTNAEQQAKKSSDRISQAGALATKAFAAIGGIGIAYSLVHFAEQTIQATAALDDMAERTGASVEQLSKFQRIAEISGLSIDTIEQAMIKLTATLGGLDEKSKNGVAALKAIGLDPDQLRQLNDTGLAFEIIGKRLNEFRDGANKTAFLRTVLGRGGAGAAPFIKDLDDSIAGLSLRTERNAKEAEDLEKNWRRLIAASNEAKRNFIIELVPALDEVVRAIITAKRESGLLAAAWVALGGGFALLTGQTSIQELHSQLEETEKSMASIRKQLQAGSLNPPSAGFKEAFNFLIPDTKLTDEAQQALRKQLAFLELRRKLILDRINPPKPDKELPNVPAIPDESKLKAIEEARRKLIEQREKFELEALKDSTAHKQAILDQEHNTFLVSDEEFYRRKVALAATNAEAEVAVLKKAADRSFAEAGRIANEGKKAGEARAAAKDPELQAALDDKKVLLEKEYYEAVARGEAALNSQIKVLRELRQLRELTALQAAAAEEAYGRSIEGVKIQILELTGETEKAAKWRNDLANADLRKRAVARGEAGASDVAAIDELAERVAKQAAFNKERERESEITARLAIGEERVQNSLRVGATSQLEALYRTGELRKQAVAQLEGIVAAQERVARESGNPVLILQADQARAALEKLRSEADLLAMKFEDIFAGSAADAFADFISGTKTAKEAFNDFTKSVTRQINQLVSEALTKQLWKVLTGAATGADESGSYGSGGGIFGSILKFLGIGGAAPAAAMSSGEFGATALIGLAGYATGTDFVPKTGLYKLHYGERVVPADENYAGWKSGMAVTNNFFLSGPVDTRTQDQVAASAGKGVQRALSRNT